MYINPEIILCGCGWTGTREDWHTHNRTDSRHAACQRCAELDAAKKRISELERENADSEASIEALNSKVKSLSAHETCGCSYDTPSDVCLHHSPIVIQLKADLEAAEKLLKLSRNAPGCCVCDEIDAYFQAKGER